MEKFKWLEQPSTVEGMSCSMENPGTPIPESLEVFLVFQISCE